LPVPTNGARSKTHCRGSSSYRSVIDAIDRALEDEQRRGSI
jgi:hypothetical protein